MKTCDSSSTVSTEVRKPLLSVIMPVFNSAPYLAESIASVLSQTNVDFEFLIIYDLSTDNSFAIIERYRNIDSRIRVLMGNKTLVGALNQGIIAAEGEFIVRMDADDISYPHRFDRQLAWLHETGADITGSWIELLHNQSSRTVKVRQTDPAIKMEMLFCSPFKHPAVMMRASLAKNLLYDPAYTFAEDYDLWVRCAVAGWKMTNVQEALLQYRVHSMQKSSALPIEQRNCSLYIRHRYWSYMSHKIGLAYLQLEGFDHLFEIPGSKTSLDQLDKVVNRLVCSQTTKEELDVLLDQTALKYILAAADTFIILSRQNSILSMFSPPKLLFFQVALLLVYVFRIHPGRTRGLSLINLFYFSAISGSWRV